MRTFVTAHEVRQASRSARAKGSQVGFVPTMGALHDGHLSLISAARAFVDVVVVSIYVNPPQFDSSRDLATYPADVEADLALCREAGVDIVWLPETRSMYPVGYSTWVTVSDVTETLEGTLRAEHFKGVATVVCKLFHGVEPDVAYFGQKDYQQQLVIRRMVADLEMPVDVVTVPTVREPDGLALSSRNIRLAPDERKAARCLVMGLRRAQAAHAEGQDDARTLEKLVREAVGAEPLARLEYAEVRDAVDLSAVERCDRPVVLVIAAHVGPVRLIDNIVLKRPLG